MILVVGATGQLGSAAVSKLTDLGRPVRAMARRSSSFDHLARDGVDLVFGDLCDPNTLDAACQNVDTIIATANTAVPSQKRDSFTSVDGRGYENLIRSAQNAGVRHIIYTSMLSHPDLDRLPLGVQKRRTERNIVNSGLEYTILRADAFMDVSFAMMGSDLPIRGEASATVERPFWFTSRFFNGVRDSMNTKGKVGIIGDGDTKHSYVCIDDLATILVNAVDNPRARNRTFDIGGPEAISQNELLKIFEGVLGRSLEAKHTPANVFKIGYGVLKFLSPAAANIMGLNYNAAVNDSIIEMSETSKLFDVKLTSAEEFLRRKAAEISQP